MCPILAFARYILAYPEVTHGGKLFMSVNPYQRFSKILQKTLEDSEEIFNVMGIDIDKIGTHSAQKGAATSTSTGSTVSPPMVSICLRAGWSMGPVKDKYIHYEKAGDQYFGRVLPRLNVNSPEFGVSPPYFEFNDTDTIIEEEIKAAIGNLIVGNRRIYPQILHLVKMSYASIYYHHRYLDEKLHGRSRIRQIPLFQQCKDEWKAKVRIRYP